MDLLLRNGRELPTRRMIWLPTFTAASTMLQFRILTILYHFLPAIFFDIFLKASKSKIRLKEIYRKVFYHSMLLQFFMSRSWKFNDVKIREIYRSMSAIDHEDFPVTMTSADYEKNGYQGIEGLLKYFFKEDQDDLKIARKRSKMFKVLHNLLLAVVYGLIASLIYRFVGWLTVSNDEK